METEKSPQVLSGLCWKPQLLKLCPPVSGQERSEPTPNPPPHLPLPCDPHLNTQCPLSRQQPASSFLTNTWRLLHQYLTTKWPARTLSLPCGNKHRMEILFSEDQFTNHSQDGGRERMGFLPGPHTFAQVGIRFSSWSK